MKLTFVDNSPTRESADRLAEWISNEIKRNYYLAMAKNERVRIDFDLIAFKPVAKTDTSKC